MYINYIITVNNEEKNPILIHTKFRLILKINIIKSSFKIYYCFFK